MSLTELTRRLPGSHFEMNWNFDCLWQFVTKQFRSPRYSVHGPEHWRRVERNGLLLATRSGADIAVVRLFALFHDSRRQNDGRDDGHGTRGAEYAKTLHGVAYDLPNDRFELLYYACVGTQTASITTTRPLPLAGTLTDLTSAE